MEKTLRGINGVYYTIYMLTILSAIIVFMLNYLNISGTYIDEKSPQGVALSSTLIIYMLISVPLTFWYFFKYSKKIQQITDRYEKFRIYKKASIIRLWIIGIGLIAGVLLIYFMHSFNMIYLAGIEAVALFFCKPTANKMIKDLDLADEDI